MIQKYMLPLLVVVLIAFAVGHAFYVQRAQPENPPPVPPPTTPFGDTVAGAGIIEPSSEASGTGNIAIGSQLAGVVTTVPVRIGQTVKAGDLLFGLDSRQTEADLKVRRGGGAGEPSTSRSGQGQSPPDGRPIPACPETPSTRRPSLSRSS